MSNDRFTAPKPVFIKPSNALVAVDGSNRRDTSPGQSVMKKSLPPLTLLTIAPKVRRETKKKEIVSLPVPVAISSEPLVKYGSEHILSDEEFVIKTRARNIHEEEIKQFFYANGGAEIIDNYATIAQAFEALVRQKKMKLSGITSEEYKRHQPKNSDDVVFVPGQVKNAQLIRERAKEAAREHLQNDIWLSKQNKKTG